MAASGSVWGIEIGQCALKAIKLRATPEGVEVAAYEQIEHEKILSQPNANREELIASALRKFVERQDPKGERFVIGVPGQQTFARFCKLPPAEPKKIPQLVNYEAQQQIPFEMSDVVWDYQKFEDPESPDVEVGIFAMRKDLIQKHLDLFDAVRIRPYMVQTVPSALYNFARYDYEDGLKDGALVVIDVGTQNTDLVIVEPNRAWYRNIPLGGNAFTDALVRSFKLEFPKAEQLKRSAASSKYARQIFQAMRPVFAELVAEIQRSIGFYGASHRDTELKQVLAVGNAFRLPGLQKYIENNLSIPGGVIKLEGFKRVRPGAELDVAKLNDQSLSLAAVSGLALQGLNEARITADLLPPELARLAVWKRKQWWFAAAAGVAGLAAVLPMVKNSMDSAALGDGSLPPEATAAISTAQNFQTRYNQVMSSAPNPESFKKYQELLSKKRVIPGIVSLIHEAIPVDPELAAASTPEDLKRLIQSDPVRYARNKRKQIFIDSLTIDPVTNLDGLSLVGPSQNAQRFGDSGDAEVQGFLVHVSARVPYGSMDAEVSAFIRNEFLGRLRELAKRPGMGFHIPPEDTPDPAKSYIDPDPAYVRLGAGGIGGGIGGIGGGSQAATDRDPITGEPTGNDWRVDLDVKFKLGDAPPPPENTNAGNPA
jgi:type IV pilus assembly protein PilM